MTDKQKRLLGIGGVSIAGLIAYRRMHSGRTQSNSGRLTNSLAGSGASGSIAPYTPQSPILVPPGESVYDPNSESLLNTPPQSTSDTPPQSTTPGAPAYTVNVIAPRIVGSKTHRKRPTKRTHHGGHGGHLHKPHHPANSPAHPAHHTRKAVQPAHHTRKPYGK